MCQVVSLVNANGPTGLIRDGSSANVIIHAKKDDIFAHE